MATIERTVELIFAGKDELSTVLGSVKGGLTSFRDAIESAAEPIARIGEGVLATDAALLALAAAGLTVAVKKAVDFEDATIELVKVLGDEEVSIKDVQSAVFELSNRYGENAASILSNVAAIKQAGFDVAQSLEIQKAALDLVIAGDLEGAEATEILISTLKGFQAPASEVTRIIDILNAVSNQYATDVEQLGIGMAKLSPIAGTVGLSFEETAAILTPVIEVFRSGDEAATALKTGLARLVDNNPAIIAALKNLEVAQRDANGQLRPAGDILLDVAKAFETANDADKLFIASQLVGINQAAKLVTVFDQGAKITEILAVAMGSAGSAAEEVAKRMESAGISIDRFRVGFENLATVIGLEFLEAASDAIDGATAIENTLQDLVEAGAFQDIVDKLQDFFLEIGEFLEGVAEALPEALEDVNFDPILNALESLQDAFVGIFDDLDLRKPEDLAKVIQAAVGSLGTLVNLTQGIVTAFEPIFAALAGAIQAFNELSDAEKITIGEDLLGQAIIIKNAGLEIAAALALIGDDVALWADIFSKAIHAVTAVWELLTAQINATAALIVWTIEKIIATLNLLTFDKFEGLRNLEKSLEDLSQRFLDIATKHAVRFVESVFDTEKATTDLSSGIDTLSGHTKGLADAFTVVSTHTDKSKDSIVDYGTESHKLASAFQSAASATDNYITHIDDLGFGFAQGKDNVEAFHNVVGGMDAVLRKAGIEADATSIHVANLKDETGDASNRFGDLIQNAEGVWTNLGTIKDIVPGTTAQMVQLGRDTITAGGALHKATDETYDFQLAIAKIQADLAAKKLEVTADIRVAQIQADARAIEAVIDSLGQTFDNTGDQITTLFNQLADAMAVNNNPLANMIRQQIQREEFRREQTFQTQQRIADAYIENLRIRNQILQSGAGLIQIDSTGLEPALEQVMWSILEKVQLRVNEQAADFLIGLP